MATEPKLLFITIPDIPNDAPFEFHPISRSDNPQRYKRNQLRDTGEAQTPWLTFFEQVLLGIFWKTGAPVPFVFRTADGKVRSLDAGCIKWLLNRDPPELRVHPDEAGVIEAVTPSDLLVSRHVADKEALVTRLSWKKPKA